NFPNPFNPATTIRFSLAEDGMTTLKIFDIMGREITTLAAEYLRQGAHEYQWNGTNEYSQQAATGIYFYRLQSGNNVSVKKMLLMK
ncbi:MAG: T9SS type A sorting domain-containing protein, partial [Bacteroidota bacterium]